MILETKAVFVAVSVVFRMGSSYLLIQQNATSRKRSAKLIPEPSREKAVIKAHHTTEGYTGLAIGKVE